MDLKFGVLLVIVGYISATLARSPCVCTRDYKPVCGSDGHTYSNECLMECANKDVTALWKGPCESQKQSIQLNTCVCPLQYLPVCGNDGVTYPNMCSIECQKQLRSDLVMIHKGACEPTTVTPREPSCFCTREMKPVCGSDGNTYNNDCLLNCATKNNHLLSIDHYGPCDESVKVVTNLFG